MFSEVEWFGWWDPAHRVGGARWDSVPVLINLDVGDEDGMMSFFLPCCGSLGINDSRSTRCAYCDVRYDDYATVRIGTSPHFTFSDSGPLRYWLAEWHLNPLEVELAVGPSRAETASLVEESKAYRARSWHEVQHENKSHVNARLDAWHDMMRAGLKSEAV